MDKRLLKLYREHASSEEAIAILFVKKYLSQAKGYWVDIKDYNRYEMSSDDFHFRYVTGSLYRKKIQPKYPPKSEYTNNGKFDERQYYLMIRAITWETAQRDIKFQKSKKVKAKNFKITGVSYDKNRNNTNFFRDDAPPEIKALAKDLLNRTDPLWDDALKYAIKPEFVYQIKRIRVN